MSLAAACSGWCSSVPRAVSGSGQRCPRQSQQHSWQTHAQHTQQDSCMAEQAGPVESGCIPGREGTGTRSPVAVLALSYSQPQTKLHLRVSFAAS